MEAGWYLKFRLVNKNNATRRKAIYEKIIIGYSAFSGYTYDCGM